MRWKFDQTANIKFLSACCVDMWLNTFSLAAFQQTMLFPNAIKTNRAFTYVFHVINNNQEQVSHYILITRYIFFSRTFLIMSRSKSKACRNIERESFQPVMKNLRLNNYHLRKNRTCHMWKIRLIKQSCKVIRIYN